MPQQRLAKAVRILLVLILLVVILVYAKPFLVPLAFAGVLSLLLLPITRWLERRGINKAVATLLTLLAFLSVFAALFFFIGWQLSGITEDASQMEQQFSQKLQQLKSSISKTFGVSPQKQQQIIKQQQQQAPGKTSAFITGLLSGIGLFLTNTILMLVYLFLLLYYRGHLKTAILKFVPESERGNAEVIMHDSQQVTYKYITGLGLMIVSLWIMYGIGFSIAGVKNPLFFAVLCGVLEIIPFVGNLAGTLLTMGMALSQGGSTNMLIGIAVTYGVVQFIQS
jgi:predicted PurR-regulated permease PerM